MEIEVLTPRARIAAALVDHARRRLLYVLRPRQHQVQRVEVRLGETRSRRGLHDVYCRIQLQLVDGIAASVVDIGTDLYQAIDRAVDRAGQVVAEQLRGGRLAPA